jgi:hypothetical protein
MNPEQKPFPGRTPRESAPIDTGNPPSESQPVDDFARLTSGIQSAIDECRRTDWSADNAAEYAVFQQLSRDLAELQDDIRSLPPDTIAARTRTEALDGFLDAMVDSLQADLVPDDFQSGKSNQWFASAVNTDNPWCVLAVEVDKSAIDSGREINGMPTCLLKILGTRELIVAPLLVSNSEFRTGSQFLVFGQLTPPEPDDRSLMKVVSVHVSFQITRRGSR